MKRIGILTIHRIYNHGSFLQAFAVKTLVEKLLSDGTVCEFMDWPPKNSEIKFNYELPTNSLIKPFGLKYWIHKKLGHEVYCRDVELAWVYNQLGIKYIRQCQQYLGVKPEPNYNTSYDAIIVGSDESFNCTQNDAKWDGLFCFNLKSHIVSYAASFGYSTIDRLNQYNMIETIKNGLLSYKAISVRDKNSQDIVKALTETLPEINLDPVLIFDYSKYIPTIKRNENFILVYNYLNRINDPGFIKEIKKLARREHLEIISVFEYCPWADKNIALTSFEVLAYYEKAKYVITDTFHGVVMSIKFNKRFATFVRDSNYNKLHFLLEQFGLENQIISCDQNIKDILMRQIDWEAINGQISIERNRTINYFKKSLKEL